MVSIYGTITDYMGTAYTGMGLTHKYDDLLEAATTAVFLKCPPTNLLSEVLNEISTHFVKRGYDVERFIDPIAFGKTDAIFIPQGGLLFLQASHPIPLEPTNLGGKHHVMSFYDVYDEAHLRKVNATIVEHLEASERTLEKALQALADAKQIHDDWELLNGKRMMWELHEGVIQSLIEELFRTLSLNKQAQVSHRLIGSLTSGGAHDYIPSITKKVQRRLLIKGLPGTGKSTLMKALGAEAEKRGFDVLYGWCGLDPSGVDLVQFPEMSLCLFDATQPHAYDPEHAGDELLDLVQMCEKNEGIEREIQKIRERYGEKILDAKGYMQAYAQADHQVRLTMDTAVQQDFFKKKCVRLNDFLS